MAKKLSSSFASSATRSMSEFDRMVESRMSKRLDVFTDDFSPPGTAEISPGQDVNKRSAPYGKKHEDYIPQSDPNFWQKGREGPWASQLPRKMHSAGDPKDQQPMDDLDETEYRHEAPIKKSGDQFPGIPKVVHNPYDEFPGDVDMEDHKKIAGFDPHLTDPARLKSMPYESQAQQGYMHVHHPEIAKKWDKEDKGNKNLPYHKQSKLSTSETGPEAFHKEVEKRMKCLEAELPKDSSGVKEDPKPTREPKWNSGKNPDQTMSRRK